MVLGSSLDVEVRAASLLLVLLLPTGVAAQTAESARRPSWFLNLDLGLAQPSATEFSMAARYLAEDIDYRSDYRIKNAPIFGIGAGVLLGPRFGVGVAVSRYADNQPAGLAFAHAFPTLHTAQIESEPLQRTETAVHIQFAYVVPVSSRLKVTFFGGPSHFSAAQRLIADVEVDETFDGRTRAILATISELGFEDVDGSAWGFNVGADVSYFVHPSVGVGALVRYCRATVNLLNPILSSLRSRTVNENVDVGGLQVIGGLRLRF